MRDPRDPAVHIPRTVNGALNALKAAAAEPGMQRFVYTSSSLAVTNPKPNKQFTVTTDTFNEEAVEKCKQPGVSSSTVYAASKVAAERAIEQWVRENKSSLVVNTREHNGFCRVTISLLTFLSQLYPIKTSGPSSTQPSSGIRRRTAW